MNGQVVEEQGLRIDPATAVVHVDGKRIPTAPDNIVLVMNKPRGVITTMHDEQGRHCVGDLIADRPERLFYIGRLDADTEGLLLLTNDGELANRVGIIANGKLAIEGTPAALKRAIGADVVVARVPAHEATLVAALVGGIAGVESVEVQDDEAIISVVNGASAVSPIAVALSSGDIHVLELTLRTPTLDDVFLHATGNRLQERNEVKVA